MLKKSFLLLITLFSFFVMGSLIYLCFFNKTKRLKQLSRLTYFISPLILYILDVHYKVNFPEEIRHNQNYLIVANHLSYLDAVILSACLPSLFITSKEVEATPFLGWITKISGCFFVERRKVTYLKCEIDKISEKLNEGFNVILFPEGTSSNGSNVLPFKKPFLSAAIDAKVNILPICIQYQTINKIKICEQNRDTVFYYGVMDFFPHLIQLFKQQEISVELKILPAIKTEGKQCRKELATLAHQAISLQYQPAV